MSFARLLRVAGLTLISAGVLALLFVAFQLWGTGVFQAQHQATLRNELDTTLRQTRSLPKHRSTSTRHSTVVPAPAMAPPAVSGPVGTIVIPKIGLNQVIIEGVGESQLSLGPGHYPGTPLPGEAGNVSIAGHRTTWGHPFYNLNELVRGDKIVITTAEGTFTYQTLGEKVVLPSDVAVLRATSTPQLTLTTCNPRFSAAQRLVLTAKLVASVTNGTQKSSKPSTPSVHRTVTTPSSLTAGSSDGTTALWRGILLLVIVGLVILGKRRIRRPSRRRVVYGVGSLGFLVVLFWFFASISLLLPASF